MPLIAKIKELEEKHLARSKTIVTLKKHKIDETLPKGLIDMRKPIVPASVDRAFSADFDILIKKANSEALRLMIVHREVEITTIQTEIDDIKTEINTKVTGCLVFMQSSTGLQPTVQNGIETQYARDLDYRLELQTKKITIASAFNTFREVEKQEASIANQLIEDNQPDSQENRLEELQKTVRDLSKQVSSMNKKSLALQNRIKVVISPKIPQNPVKSQISSQKAERQRG